MKKGIHRVSHCYQTAYVKGWYIGKSVRLVNNLITHDDSLIPGESWESPKHQLSQLNSY